MTTTTVTGTAALLSALSQAQAGDTILLAAGVYSGVNLWGLNYSSPVTIASADPAHMAQLRDLFVQNCSNITFQNLEMDTTGSTKAFPFDIYSSSNLTFSSLKVHGTMDGDPANDGNAFLFQNSSHITFTNSEFQQLAHAIMHVDNTYLTFTNNNFHDLRTGAIQGGGASYVLIANNTFTNFYPHTKPEDHPDAIQFWTTGETTSAHDITITGNTFTRGSGEVVQGIFLRDEVGSLPYYNVTISGNTISGALYRGISVTHAINLSITDNVVQGYTDMQSWISVGDTTNATLTNNSATMYMYEGTNTNLIQSGNITIPYIAPTVISPVITTTTPTITTTPTTSTPTPLTPPAPTDLHLDDSTDSGVVGDGRTKMAVVSMEGVAQAGAQITVYADGAAVGTGVADASGVFSVNTSALSDGVHSMTAKATVGGVVSTQSAAASLVIDTHAAASQMTYLSVNKAGNQTGVGISGVVADNLPGAVTVKIYQDGALLKTQQTEGGWSMQANVSNAVHTFNWETVDLAGNVAAGPQRLIVGSTGADRITGSAGADVIFGNGGGDTLLGGGGNDVFAFGPAAAGKAGRTTTGTLSASIGDFSTGDKLDLQALGHSTFIGQSQTVGPHQVAWYVSGANTVVVADTNGDSTADLMVQLVGYHPLSGGDFLLG
jgi:hypothetical protein